MDSGHQARQQVLLHTEPSCCSGLLWFLFVVCDIDDIGMLPGLAPKPLELSHPFVLTFQIAGIKVRDCALSGQNLSSSFSGSYYDSAVAFS